jgi:hypothetical protein
MLKKIIVAMSFFIVILFLITPSIQAIRFEIVKDAVYEDCINQMENKINENLKNIKYLKEVTEYPHPFLFYIVMLILYLRFLRFLIYYLISTEYDQSGFWPELKIKHPMIYFLAIILSFRIEIWYVFWYKLSEKMGWNWY